MESIHTWPTLLSSHFGVLNGHIVMIDSISKSFDFQFFVGQVFLLGDAAWLFWLLCQSNCKSRWAFVPGAFLMSFASSLGTTASILALAASFLAWSNCFLFLFWSLVILSALACACLRFFSCPLLSREWVFLQIHLWENRAEFGKSVEHPFQK